MKNISRAKQIFLPPLNIKLALMKLFVKALKKMENVSNLRKLIEDEIFESKIEKAEKLAWKAFKDAVTKFLGNKKK